MTSLNERVATARGLLFVPGSRPDRFDKAVSASCGLAIIDLEDAVAAAHKTSARDHTSAWLAQGNQAVVRVNPPSTPWFEADLETAVRHACPVLLPKAEDPGLLVDIAARIAGRCALIPLVETAAGVERAHTICTTPGVVRVAFGNIDLALQLGVAPDDHTALAHARSRLVLASAAAGIAPPIDGVTTALRDAAVLQSDIGHSRRLGFTGKLCIHPDQLPHVVSGFLPPDREVRWARTLLEAGDSVTAVDGHMIDKPVLLRARRVLAAAEDPHAAM